MKNTEKWFTVKAAFLIKAESADEAEDEMADILEQKHVTDDYYVIGATKTRKDDLPQSGD